MTVEGVSGETGEETVDGVTVSMTQTIPTPDGLGEEKSIELAKAVFMEDDEDDTYGFTFSYRDDPSQVIVTSEWDMEFEEPVAKRAVEPLAEKRFGNWDSGTDTDIKTDMEFEFWEVTQTPDTE